MKIKTLLPLLMVFISAKLLSSENIIAYNHDKTIVLTKELLNNWLELNQPYKLHDKEKQINSYFLEKSLLQKQNLIDDETLEKIEFNHKRLLYRNSFAIYKKEVVSKIDIYTDQYNELLSQLSQKNKAKKDKVRLYQIFKKFPNGADSQLKKQYFDKMQSIRRSINGIDAFKKMAQAESDSQSRLRMGLIGNVHHGLFPKKLNDIVMKMEVGELSEVIESPDGLMLFYCESHIPAYILTEKEMRKSVKNTLMSYKTKVNWSEFNNKIVDDLNIQYDLTLIGKNKASKIVAKSKNLKISQVKLKWLMNDSNLTRIKEKNIKSTINNYFVGHHLYHNLSIQEKQELQDKNNQSYTNSLTSAVMLELINNSFKKPSNEELLNYYYQNKEQFIKPKQYDVSFITFKIESDEKSKVYATAQSVLQSLNIDPNSFEMYSQKYYINTPRFKNARIKSISENRLGVFFGINVTKQIHLLKQGEISKLVESDSGFLWIVRLNKILDNRLMTFEEAKNQIDKRLGTKMLKELENKIILKILSEQKITFVK